MEYNVKVIKTYSTVYTVQANSEDEALENAKCLPVDFDCEDYVETEIMG